MEIVLHIGAHRAGSTAVEQALSLNGAALAAEGVAIWTPRMLRKAGRFREAPALARRGGAAWGVLRADLAARLRAGGGDLLFLSEENMLGGMAQNLRGGLLYPQARARMTAFRDVLPVPPKRIALGIRGYRDYWLSAYTYVLRGKDLPDFAALAPALAALPRGWLDLARDLRAVFPEAEICLWPMEGLSVDLAPLAFGLVERTSEARQRPTGRVNTGLKPGHIPAIAALKAAEPGITVAEIEARLRDRPVGDFTGFTPAEEAAMAARYDEDLEALAAGAEGIRLIAVRAGA